MKLEKGEIIQVHGSAYKLPLLYYCVEDATNFNRNNRMLLKVRNMKWGCLEKAELVPWTYTEKAYPKATVPEVRLVAEDNTGYDDPRDRQFFVRLSVKDLKDGSTD